MTDIQKKIDKSIERLRTFEPEEGYYLCFSGGKDSQTIYHLAQMAGVKFDAHYNVTSVDPPELVRFIKTHYPDVQREISHDKNGKPVTMWNLIARQTIPPLRIYRYCCKELKENPIQGRLKVTGVRWAESVRRSKNHGNVTFQSKPKTTQKAADALGLEYGLSLQGNVILNDDNDESRRLVEQCYRTQTTLVNPIVDWEESDVWEFLNNVVKVEHCCLYDEGYTRIGCIGCPMANLRERERGFERWPKFKQAYIHAFERMLANRTAKGKSNTESNDWSTPEKVFDWWLYGEVRSKQLKGQLFIDDFSKESDKSDNH